MSPSSSTVREPSFRRHPLRQDSFEKVRTKGRVSIALENIRRRRVNLGNRWSLPRKRRRALEAQMEAVQCCLKEIEEKHTMLDERMRLHQLRELQRQQKVIHILDDIEMKIRPALASLEAQIETVYPEFIETQKHRDIFDQATRQARQAAVDMQSRSGNDVNNATKGLKRALKSAHRSASQSKQLSGIVVMICAIVMVILIARLL